MVGDKWQGFNGLRGKDLMISRLLAPLFFFSVFALFPPVSSAQIYKYVDKDGGVHFTNTPTDPGYKSYMAAEPEKREAADIQPRGPARNYKTLSKGNNDLDNLDELDDLDNLDKLDELEDLPSLPDIP